MPKGKNADLMRREGESCEALLLRLKKSGHAIRLRNCVINQLHLLGIYEPHLW
jgi:hypothetical protein